MHPHGNSWTKAFGALALSVSIFALPGTASAQLFGPITNGAGPPGSASGGLILNNVGSDLAVDFVSPGPVNLLADIVAVVGSPGEFDLTVSLVGPTANDPATVTASTYDPLDPSVLLDSALANLVFTTTQRFTNAEIGGGGTNSWSYCSAGEPGCTGNSLIIPLFEDGTTTGLPPGLGGAGTLTLQDDLDIYLSGAVFSLFQDGAGSLALGFANDEFSCSGGSCTTLDVSGVGATPVSIFDLSPLDGTPPTGLSLDHDLCWNTVAQDNRPDCQATLPDQNQTVVTATGFIAATVVPEPGMLSLLAAGLAGLWAGRRGRAAG